MMKKMGKKPKMVGEEHIKHGHKKLDKIPAHKLGGGEYKAEDMGNEEAREKKSKKY